MNRRHVVLAGMAVVGYATVATLQDMRVDEEEVNWRQATQPSKEDLTAMDNAIVNTLVFGTFFLLHVLEVFFIVPHKLRLWYKYRQDKSEEITLGAA